MSPTSSVSRTGEYAERGDYHRQLSTEWEFYPTYLAKLEHVRRYLSALPERTRVLDAGCGEGVLVDEFHARLAIEGLDPNYSSQRVIRGSLHALPYAAASFDRALCLDVLEHLTFAEQPKALAELFRVIAPGGELLVTVPNLAHLQSRVHFALRGRLIHTANLAKHPGDRPAAEYLDLARAVRLPAGRASRHLSDCAGAHALDPARARATALAASAADAAAPHSRLVLSERAALRAPLTRHDLARSRPASDERRGDLRGRRCRRAGRQLPAAPALRQGGLPHQRGLRRARAPHRPRSHRPRVLEMGRRRRVHAPLPRAVGRRPPPAVGQHHRLVPARREPGRVRRRHRSGRLDRRGAVRRRCSMSARCG